ncbi:MAG: hypothetical protein HC927_10970 [Deltaproteobacteria bacterium]|nr:hypothetical protein [Deltaproteobacteria bacterium]
MPTPDWDERYATGHLPWDTGEPAPHLVELVERGTIMQSPPHHHRVDRTCRRDVE